MRIDMTDEERDILIRWKKRSDTYRLVRIEGGGGCVRCPWCRPGHHGRVLTRPAEEERPRQMN